MDKVDLVVPYVDSSDPNWQRLFNQFNPIKDKEIEGINAQNRFRGQGDFFKYFFLGVSKFAPWISSIILIVQNQSQVPTWISDYPKVRVVYHREFIPKEFLPTFNSTCIEMFVPFIEGLSEKFLYANDDTFFFEPTAESGFFEGSYLLNRFMTYSVRSSLPVYSHHALNSYCRAFELDPTKTKTYKTLKHTIRPYLKSLCQECFSKYQNAILSSISQFREEKNFNMYLYDFYALKVGRVKEGGLKNEIVLWNNLPRLESYINRHPNIICIQDGGPNNIYLDRGLNECFYKHYHQDIDHFDLHLTFPVENPEYDSSLEDSNNDSLPSLRDYSHLLHRR